MTVTTLKKAWQTADEIFPTDYMKDDIKSENAGYDIYTSTADGNNSYISDLGDRLEINLDSGKTINIWIEEPKYTEKKLDEILNKVDDILYDLGDNFTEEVYTENETGFRDAYKSLYAVFGKCKAICDKFYPESYLYKKYNLNEA